jgi:hypothetical protein
MMAVWLMIHGGVSLFIVATVMHKLADVTTPDQPDLVRDILGVFFGTLSLHAGFYICAGLAMLISPSLKSFFRHQSQTASNPFTTFSDWIRRLVQRDRPAQLVDEFLRKHRNRRRYPVLTRTILESLDDFELAAAVVDHVQLRIDAQGGSDFAVVSSLPRGFQAVYSTWWARVEFDNGGLYQYFYNHGVDWAFMALEGYKLLGAVELAGVMTRAIDVYLREEPEQSQHRTDDPRHMIERYVESHAASSLPELDRAFGAAPQEQAAEYIRCHLDEFITA